MKTSCTLVRKTGLEKLIESGDKAAINKMIEQKEKVLEEAINNAEFQSSIGLDEMADNEVARQQRLIKDIERLQARLNSEYNNNNNLKTTDGDNN